MPDLELRAEEAAWASVTAQAAAHVADFDISTTWRVLGDLGVFGTVLPEYGGGPLEMAIAVQALGRHAIDGPLMPSLLAARCLPTDLRTAVVSGESVVGMVIDGVGAWAVDADLMVAMTKNRRLAIVEAAGSPEPFDTLAGSRWLTGEYVEVSSYAVDPSAFALADLAIAAWLVGAAQTLVSQTAQHARERQQFGRPIGSFQAIAHPLAAAGAEVDGAAELLMHAAWSNRDRTDERLAAQSRLIARRAAMEALAVAHQTHGALGFSSECPIGRFSTRIRQVSLVSPRAEVSPPQNGNRH